MWSAVDDLFVSQDDLEKLFNKIKTGFDYAFPDVAIVDSAGKLLRSKVMHPFEEYRQDMVLQKPRLSLTIIKYMACSRLLS